MQRHQKTTLYRLASSLLALLMAASALPQAVSAATPAPPQQDTPAVAPAPAGEQAFPTIDCNDPIPGQKARLFGDEEVLVNYRYRDDNTSLRSLILDNSGSNLTQLESKYYGGTSALSSIRRLSLAGADLNGDDKTELVSVLRDKSERIAAVSNAVPTSEWYADGDEYKGDNLNWFSPAAGDLDRSRLDQVAGGDEVAIAFEDDNDDIRIMVVDGQPTGAVQAGANKPLGLWYDPDDHDGRGDVGYVTSAVGDLNGDGYDDEIVAAFHDGNDNLQVLIVRLNEDGTTTLLWNRYWTNYDRGDVADDESQFSNRWPISATAGDVDGDLRDEAVIGFRSGDSDHGDLQLLVLDLTRELKGATPATDKFEMDDSAFMRRSVDASNHWAEAATAVSVSAADLDGDGRDEIAVGYTTVYNYSEHDMDRYWEQHLMTYKYTGVTEPGWGQCADGGIFHACLDARSGDWKSGRTKVPFAVDEDNVEASVWISTGDIDLDGRAEIALGRTDHDSGDLLVYTFDAENGLHQRTAYTVDSGGNRIEDFRVAMGDADGDSWYGTYVGGSTACRERKDALVTAVLHAPPYWPEVNEEEAVAAFGQNIGSGGGTGKTAESSVSASVTAKWQIKEIGPSFSHEWEKATAVESQSITTTVEGEKFSTHPPYLFDPEEYFGAVEFVETPFWCYDYTEPHIGLMTVCTPRPADASTVLNYSLEWWYENGPKTYAESWIPLGMNLAQGRSASQSSDNSGAGAGRAVDGNTNGDFNAGSVAHTAYGEHPWWQVDLGGEQWLDAVQFWNRSDCCADRLSNFYIFVSNDPFASDDPNVLAADPNVWHHQEAGTAGRTTTIPVNDYGRYVRVQLAGANYLQLAEVQIYGMPGAVDQWPTGRPITATNSFQLSWPGGLQQVVNGQVLYTRKGNQLGVRAGSGAAEFEVGLAREGEQVQEGSSSDKNTLGWEFRHAAGEVSAATTNKNSYILSWSKETEFSGAAGGLPKTASPSLNYAFMPYVWLQRATSSAGINQVFMVLDYWVPAIGAREGSEAASPSAPAATLGIAPQMPVVNSATHPDPATWVMTNTASFDWAQPPGDGAVVEGYHWMLDQVEGGAPEGMNLGLENTATYYELADGIWHLHVRALGDGGQWSETGQRAIHIDANAPQVKLALDPPLPTGNNDWYITPVNVTVVANDGAGAGVSAIEVSPDGVAWQPYTGPLLFEADTPGTTIYARASDATGQVSAPITATFRIDRSAPDSHVTGGAGPGVWAAEVITNSLGNEEMVLTGAFADLLSGLGGMGIEYDGEDWAAAEALGNWLAAAGVLPELNWTFSGGHNVGAGNHIFQGRALDQAGNREETYEIGRVLWFPQAAPNISGSTLVASPTTVRPGEVVSFTLAARNAGPQEAHVAMTATLPAGLALITGTLAADVVYDAAAGVLVWPDELLWPGDWVRHTFEAQAAANLPAGTLATTGTLHAFWPNSALLPPQQQGRFLEQERTANVASAVTVNPNLPAGTDVTAPWVGLNAGSRQVITTGVVPLGLVAAPDAAFMYLREWTLDPASGAWVVAQNSGWLDYSPSYTWTLSAGQGVKYLGAWVADAARNISVLDEDALVFVNRVDGNQALANGQRVQYRGDLELNNWVVATLLTVAGDPDMYVWRPANGFRPDVFSNDSVAPGQVESLGGEMAAQSGRFLLEVVAAGDSEYNLSLTRSDQEALAAAGAAAAKERPAHPLTLADPLSANQVGDGPGPKTYTAYLPVVKR